MLLPTIALSSLPISTVGRSRHDEGGGGRCFASVHQPFSVCERDGAGRLALNGWAKAVAKDAAEVC